MIWICLHNFIWQHILFIYYVYNFFYIISALNIRFKYVWMQLLVFCWKRFDTCLYLLMWYSFKYSLAAKENIGTHFHCPVSDQPWRKWFFDRHCKKSRHSLVDVTYTTLTLTGDHCRHTQYLQQNFFSKLDRFICDVYHRLSDVYNYTLCIWYKYIKTYMYSI